MKTSVERVDATTVKLLVTVERPRIEEALDHVAGHLAEQVNVPGFRRGRVPRRVLESRIGKEALVEEALREFLPTFYREAVDAEGLEVAGPPEFDVDTFETGKEANFTATVEVRPEITPPDLDGVQVAHPEWEVTDEELDAKVDELRERFATVETVERAADVGDLVVLTLTAEHGGQPVEDASLEDTLYEIHDPSESDSELDRELVGSKAGAILKFRDTLGPDFADLSGETVDFTAIVKEVKRKELPAADDEFALDASEFDTIAELRDDLRRTLGRQKRAYAREELRGKVVETVTDLVDVPLPKAMVDEEQRFQLRRHAGQADRFGLAFERYVEALGTSQEDFLARLETEARATVKAQLVVDAIGKAESVDVEESDLGEEIARQSMRLQRPPEELAQLMTSSPERISALVSDAFRRKTIDRILERIEVLAAPPADDTDLADPTADADDTDDTDDTGEAPSTAG